MNGSVGSGGLPLFETITMPCGGFERRFIEWISMRPSGMRFSRSALENLRFLAKPSDEFPGDSGLYYRMQDVPMGALPKWSRESSIKGKRNAA
jgi:hypothetical protein